MMRSIGASGVCGSRVCVAAFRCLVLGVAAVTCTTAAASPITPNFDTFGTLSGATFGGTGIPNTAVAITFAGDVDHDAILGLTAHARFFNPTVTNDGAGTFFATPGANFGDPTFTTMPSSTLGATWNFAFYVDVGDESQKVRIRLLYDFDPGYFTDESNHGVIETIVENTAVVELESSQNLLFNSLSTGGTFSGVPGLFGSVTVTPPPGSITFNPNAVGSYTFSLQAYTLSGDFLGDAAIRVNVGNVVIPEPASIATWCLGGGAGLLAAARARRRRPARQRGRGALQARQNAFLAAGNEELPLLDRSGRTAS